jgi:hypothetical protein
VTETQIYNTIPQKWSTKPNSRIQVIKKELFTNTNVYSIAFVETEKIRVFFKLQSAEKDSNQRYDYTNILNDSGDVRNPYPTPIMLRIAFSALYLTLP